MIMWPGIVSSSTGFGGLQSCLSNTLQKVYRRFHMSRLLASILLFSLLAGCALQATPASGSVLKDNPYAPQSGDGTLMRGEAEIASASIQADGSNVLIQLAYRLPTPCYKLRVAASGPDSQNKIVLDAYGVAPKDRPCSLMALATPLQASLSVGSLPAGHYAVWVNGSQAGEFDK
jgi:hypothetical protein